jgi:hypothetical protein
VIGYVNDTPLYGGVITSTSFSLAPSIGSGQVSLQNGGSVVLRLEFTYSGAPSSAKEVLVDNVALTPIS